MATEGTGNPGGPPSKERPAASPTGTSRGIPSGGGAPVEPAKAAGFGFNPSEPGPASQPGRSAGFTRSGFPDARTSTSHPGTLPQAARATPLPKRPKGRYFVGSLMLIVVGTVVYGLWTTFLRYQAYGVVTGRVLRVSAPASGVLRTTHAREGELVLQGQLLATVENLELEERLATAVDQLQIAQAALDAEIGRLKWQSQIQGDLNQKAQAEYYELWGTLLQEQAKLSELEQKLRRTTLLYEENSVPQENLEAIHFATEGQRAKIQKLTVAVEELRKGAELTAHDGQEALGQLKPQLARLQSAQDEIARLRDRTVQTRVVAPVSGRIVKRYLYTGEYADISEPIFEILEDGSLEAIVYLSQRHAEMLEVGNQIGLAIEPHPELVMCVVVRIGDQLESPPESIQRRYRRDEKLVPVHTQPLGSPLGTLALRLGSEVKLPYRWRGFWVHARGQLKDATDTIQALAGRHHGPGHNQQPSTSGQHIPRRWTNFPNFRTTGAPEL